MKLRNKKTGEIVYATMMASYGGGELQIRYYPVNNAESTHFKEYRSISELNEEWEDYEEPKSGIKDVWFPDVIEGENNVVISFETEEEAEKALEKLKALTKLCKKGFEFDSVKMFGSGLIRIEASIPINEKTTLRERSDMTDSLYLLFGGEE